MADEVILDPNDMPVLIEQHKDPYHALWVQVLYQAVIDLGYGDSHHYKQTSLMWFRSNADHMGSFHWICGLLGLCPDTVYQALRRKYGLV